MIKKFEKLSPAQHRLMAFHCGSTANSRPSTGESLLSLGLVRKITHKVRGMTFVDYEVPIPIHMTYCRWCEEQESGVSQLAPPAK